MMCPPTGLVALTGKFTGGPARHANCVAGSRRSGTAVLLKQKPVTALAPSEKPVKKCLCLFAAVAILAAAPASRADDRPASAKEKQNVWMKQKLKFSQEILAGLTEGDFDKVEKNAAALNRSGYLEKWIDRGNRKHDEYELHRQTFDFYNRELIRQAKDKDIGGATVAYQLLAASCVQCHKVVRDVKK